jgi:hypothetical protein
MSTDLQNISSEEIRYDKYDDKGNSLQYTTKEGISIVIIWGYDSTLPIAKLEGAKLSDISQNLITSIVNASNIDAVELSNNDETALFTALKHLEMVCQIIRLLLIPTIH